VKHLSFISERQACPGTHEESDKMPYLEIQDKPQIKDNLKMSSKVVIHPYFSYPRQRNPTRQAVWDFSISHSLPVSNSARYLAPYFLQQNITPSWSVSFYF